MRDGYNRTEGFAHISFFLDRNLEKNVEVLDPFEASSGPVETGFPSLDDLLGGGLQRSDLMGLAACPCLDLHTLALNIAHNSAKQGSSVGLSIPVIDDEETATRLLAAEADIDIHRLRLNLFSDIEEVRVLDAVGVLSDLQIHMDGIQCQSVTELRSNVLRLHQHCRIDLLIVDLLQLVDVVRNDISTESLGEVSRSLKLLAREFEIPILAYWQFSRGSEQMVNHCRQLPDLQESWPIDEYADTVAFICREDQHISREKWQRDYGTDDYPEGIAEIVISKHRNGPIGAVPLFFRNDRARYEAVAEVSQTLSAK